MIFREDSVLDHIIFFEGHSKLLLPRRKLYEIRRKIPEDQADKPKVQVLMNFNVYINKGTGEKITKVAKSLHRSRNSIINEALEEWLDKHSETKWPKNFFDFSPVEDVPDFKSLRNDLKDNVSEDPLG